MSLEILLIFLESRACAAANPGLVIRNPGLVSRKALELAPKSVPANYKVSVAHGGSDHTHIVCFELGGGRSTQAVHSGADDPVGRQLRARLSGIARRGRRPNPLGTFSSSHTTNHTGSTLGGQRRFCPFGVCVWARIDQIGDSGT
uniref:Uncharacterized protein n=1 Tax=Ananas comosus var. bracteatus TaxID=296719 RepID=A0A6V7PH63_ANACO|nr:unnamed protein product [Ananas comosus var. bracteatus]